MTTSRSQDALLVIDKPAGMTSHDVVGHVRRWAGTRRVGHAGTLDPMATGVIVLGLERGTRLLTYVVGVDKDYAATIRLGAETVTDDAGGEVVRTAAAGAVAALDLAALRAEIAVLTGTIEQVPSSVSAIKVAGRRAHAMVRAGEAVELAPRRVVVERFEVDGVRWVSEGGSARFVDVDVRVSVSSGTYVRALARDLGRALGVGGHLTALRRTRVGPFHLAAARPLDQLGEGDLVSLGDAARLLFEPLEVTAAQARALSLGQRLSARDVAGVGGPVPSAPAAPSTPTVPFAPAERPAVSTGPAPKAKARADLRAAIVQDGGLIALVTLEADRGAWRPVAVFAQPT